MPRIINIKASDGSLYKVCSMYDDTIEKIVPSSWFIINVHSYLTKMLAIPDFISMEMSMRLLKKYVQRPCPEFLLELYTTRNKKKQEKLLRGRVVTPADLISWTLQGGINGGVLSQYFYDAGVPKDLKGRAPALIDITNTMCIVTDSKTDLSAATLKHIVEYQSKVMAQFMDFTDGRWYCFYSTYRGMTGRESGNHGQHLHFISSTYGVDRESLINDFKIGKCPKNGFHVKLNDFGS